MACFWSLSLLSSRVGLSPLRAYKSAGGAAHERLAHSCDIEYIQTLRRIARAGRRLPRSPTRRDCRSDRSERRREDHTLQLARRAASDRRWHDPFRWLRCKRPQAASHRSPWIDEDVSERGALLRNERPR